MYSLLVVLQLQNSFLFKFRTSIKYKINACSFKFSINILINNFLCSHQLNRSGFGQTAFQAVKNVQKAVKIGKKKKKKKIKSAAGA